jgi:predicted ATPase
MTSKPRRIVLTGGPGAGKTAVLEIVKRSFCAHVAVAPESATILFTGGFPRDPSEVARRAVQRAIFQVQLEIEAVFGSKSEARVVLCDRGTVDGVAYWPGPPESFLPEVGTTLAAQLARYDAVVHLAPPAAQHGYRRNEVRRESAAEAAVIDARIAAAWSRHPNRYAVPSTPHFLEKARRVMTIIEAELPTECVAGVCSLSTANGHTKSDDAGPPVSA